MYDLAHTFRNPELARLAAIAARLGARMEGEDDEGSSTALEDGIGKFFDKNVSGDGSSDDDSDDSSGADDEGEKDTDGEEEESDDESDADDSDDDDDDEQDEDEGEEESDEGEAGDEEEDEEAAPDDDDEEEEEDADEPEFRTAARRANLPTDFRDIIKSLPKEARGKARQAFERRLGAMESGFTRTMQQASEFRKERATLTADLKWIRENPIDYIFELFDKDPKLAEQFNGEVEAREESKGYQKEAALRRDRTKKEAKEAADKEATEQDQRHERAQQIESFARRLCRREQIPYEAAVEKSLYIAIVNDPKRDISEAEIQRIVNREAKTWRQFTGAKRRADAKEYVKKKVEERKQGKKRITARDQGHVPAPGRRDDSKLSLEQKMLRSARRIAPDMPEG